LLKTSHGGYPLLVAGQIWLIGHITTIGEWCVAELEYRALVA
jgi:hypothetical protein